MGSNWNDIQNKETKKKVKKIAKNKLIEQILPRWWYALPPWPPVDYKYDKKILKHKLYSVDFSNWHTSPNINEFGYKKAYELYAYPGCFISYEGRLYDLRPKTNKPCYDNLIKFKTKKLKRILKMALINQSKYLENSCYINTEGNIIANIKNKLQLMLKELEVDLN